MPDELRQLRLFAQLLFVGRLRSRVLLPASGWGWPVMLPITDVDRRRWQARGVAALGAHLARHPELPVVAWTVGQTSALVAIVDTLTRSNAEAEADLHAHARAVSGEVRRVDATGGSWWLHMSGHVTYQGSKVSVHASVHLFPQEGGEL